jgi:hypothetical protein
VATGKLVIDEMEAPLMRFKLLRIPSTSLKHLIDPPEPMKTPAADPKK